jgi:DNA-binding SARP family transcriptional activator
MPARTAIPTTGPIGIALLHLPRLLIGAAGSPAAHALAPNDAALLAMVVLQAPVSRARLAALLWPDADAHQARGNLRQRLFRLRRVAGRDVVVTGELLTLAHGVSHDLVNPAAALEADATSLHGALLGGADYADNPELAAWVAAARQQWRDSLRDALAGIAARLEAEHRIAQALPFAERLAREEPLLEHAQRQLMRLHYRRGDRGAALAVYDALRTALDRELGETPSHETQQLAAQVEASMALPGASAPPQPTPVALLHPPELVGRELPWQAMQAAWAAATPIVLLGEPGIGKSRLLAEFADAQKLHCRIAVRAGDAAVPYAVLARLVRALWLEPAPPAVAAPAQPLAPWARAELAHVVPELGPAPPGPVVPVRLRRAAEHALTSAARDIAIDDLQFADSATLELLAGGLTRLPGPRWLLATRRHDQPAALAQWLAEAPPSALAVVPLGVLDADAVARLLASLAGLDPELARLAPLLQRHAGGHPMFLLHSVIEWWRQGRQPASAAALLPLPADVRRLVEQRLEALPPDALKLAQTAALAGSDFDVDLAAGILERHPLDLLPAWRALEDALLIDDRAFVHDLVRESCRDAVPKPIRAWLHGRIAQWLAAHRPQAAPATLARHLQQAGQPVLAARAYQRAAEQARAAGRGAEECALLRQAADGFLSGGLQEERFEALRQLAVVVREAETPAAAALAAADLLACASGARQRGIALREQAVCHLRGSRTALADPLLAESAALLLQAGDHANWGHSAYLHALSTAHRDGFALAADRLLALQPWADGLTDLNQRACFSIDLAIVLDQGDQRRRARPLFERGIAYFAQQHALANLAATHTMLGRSLQQTGELAASIEHLDAAVQQRALLSDSAGADHLGVLYLGQALCDAGQWTRALALLERSLDSLAGQDSPVLAAGTRQVLARIHLRLGQPGRAHQVLGDDGAELPHLQAAMALWTRAQLSASAEQRAALLSQALACFAGQDLPFVRVPIEFDCLAASAEAAATQASAASLLARGQALLAECMQRELLAAAALGQVRLLPLMQGAARPAAELLAQVQVAQQALAQWHPVGAYLPELHWRCHRAALAASGAALAEQSLAAARHWIIAVALPNVPDAFRSSFLQRNPVNLAVLAASQGWDNARLPAGG